MTDGVDLVNGYKISRSDPLHRIVIGRIYHYTVKMLFGLKVRDVDCDFRLMRRSIFDRVPARAQQRRHLPRDDEEDQDAGFRDRGGAGASLPPRVRPVAVLQLPPAVPHRGRRGRLWVQLVVVGRHRRGEHAAAPDAGQGAAARPDAIAHERGLPRVLSRPSRAHHRRPRLHRIQPGAPARRSRRRRPPRRLAHPRLRRQPLQHRGHRGSRCA